MSLKSSKSPPSTPIDRMNAFTSSNGFSTRIRLYGLAFGFVCPYVIDAAFLPKSWMLSSSLDRTESVLVVIQSLSLASVLFLSEFISGVNARSLDKQAAFSPAAAQAAGKEPFEVIESNRIHQNQIESACIYIPAVLSAAAAGVSTSFLVATTLSWVGTRVLYRWGYKQENPFWRLFGTVASLNQSLICLGLFVYHKFQ